MKKSFVSYWVLVSVLSASAAVAQEMPPPHSMPRVPVSRETLQERREASSVPHQLQGTALVIDGEKIRIGETELRLFGVVPPQLAASFGPQARAALDTLTSGQTVSCQIRDRDRDGRLLATCQAGNADLALELLKHGLAVSARGSLAGSELFAPYVAAEEAAQNQKIGLWSITIPPAATVSAAAPVAASAPVPQHVESSIAVPASALVPVTSPLTIKDDKVAPRTDKATAPVPAPQQPSIQAKITQDIEEQHTRARNDEERWVPADQVGFFERYQILIAGALMFGTALSILWALWAQKRRDKIDEVKAIAAALRGELMAARGVCIGRIKTISTDAEDRAAAWPRIRATLYAAYVGRLGLLGAELARQIASIYGQASDYASLYNSTNVQNAAAARDTPKKQALEALSRHIDEILPKLAVIEQSGTLTYAAPRGSYTPAYAPAVPTYRAAPLSQSERVQQQIMHVPSEPEEDEAVTASEEYIEMPSAPSETGYLSSAQGGRSPSALWETVRGFIQNHRNAIVDLPHESGDTHPADTHVSEYAALIEADMARYRRQEQAESLDISPGKSTRTR